MAPAPPAPATRVRTITDVAARAEGDYVLYWMTSFRRTRSNFALQHAVAWARELSRPVLVLEPLRIDYPWASRRTHRFVVDGMVDNAEALARAGVVHYPYVEPERGAGRGLVRALAARASVVVTDDHPGAVAPRMLAAAVDLDRRVEAVDANGLLPIRSAGRGFSRAVDFRRFLQGRLAEHLWELPQVDPLAAITGMRPAAIPPAVEQRYPTVDPREVAIAGLPVDALVDTVETRGGSLAGTNRLAAFVREHLRGYGAKHNDPCADTTSGLSAYLRFGFLSSHEVLAAVTAASDWGPDRFGSQVRGGRKGWWNIGENEDVFVDQLVTWRELGLNACVYEPNYSTYESVPPWAQDSLRAHLQDRRPNLYTLEQLDAAQTHDEIWNAAQRQLRAEGKIHSYLRMLWGKKVVEWTALPEEAFERLVDLNNRYALDGRDPNSYSGIAWCFGRYDRPWGPERPIFGKVRYMSSDNALRKLKLANYLRRFAAAGLN